MHPAPARTDPKPVTGCEPGVRAPSFCAGRDFLSNRYVYLLFSPRAGGLTVGVNLNPDRRCNFDCIYCEVHRHPAKSNGAFRVDLMASELEQVLEQVCGGQLRQLPHFRDLPGELLDLKHVALSGEGEPTLCPKFAEAVQAIVHIRAQGRFPFFKIALLSNASALDTAPVQEGLRYLLHRDEVWLKLDAGSAAAFDAINRSTVPYPQVLENIKHLGRQRPVVIQSLFPLMNGREPSDRDIQLYIEQLSQLRDEGAQIALVQIYSATRPTARSGCRHLPLKVLSRIAHAVRDQTGLEVQVF